MLPYSEYIQNRVTLTPKKQKAFMKKYLFSVNQESIKRIANENFTNLTGLELMLSRPPLHESKCYMDTFFTVRLTASIKNAGMTQP